MIFYLFHKPVCGIDHLPFSVVAIKIKHIKTKTYLQQIPLCQDKERYVLSLAAASLPRQLTLLFIALVQF